MAFVSPMRYPGGKGKIANYIKYILLQNNINGTYVEPYAGGAGVACELLLSGTVDRVIINDADKSIWAFWHAVINDSERLCQRILDTPVNIDEWHIQKAVQIAADPDTFDLGFSTFFLNRTNVSGILKGGAIGGIAQGGNYLIDARFNKTDLINRIENIAEESDRIELHNLDALDLLEHIQDDLTNNSLIYFDPPYYVKGHGLYKNFYGYDDHADIATRIAQLNFPWLVSYDNVPEIRNLYADYRNLAYNLSYSVNTHYNGKEIIFFSEALNIPDHDSPLQIKRKNVEDLQLELAQA